MSTIISNNTDNTAPDHSCTKSVTASPPAKNRLEHLGKYIQGVFKSGPIAKRKGRKNFLKSASYTLPSERKVLTHLISDKGDRITKSEEMADLLKKTWGPIWSHVDPEREIISDYLRDYTKHIERSPPKMSEEHFRTVMSKPRDSSTGPDGIPFSIYRSLVDIAAPLLHRYALSIAIKGRINRSFNYTNLFFFPKDDAGRVDRTRPISVSNTDNRIIANVVRHLISPTLGSLLDDSQTAFLPGKLIEDPIFEFNEKFYGAKLRNETYSILFHDFKKAYDSVSRVYLFSLLEKIGIPKRLIRIIKALYSNVQAFPILTDPHSITIEMSNGLKQGCPLSPLLFNLAIDPLLTKLSKIREADNKAYCDDIGIGSSDWEVFPEALNQISTFNKASNMASNASKTFVITTDLSPPNLKELLPSEWTSVRFTDSYKYLGVLMGPGVDVNKVFQDAWYKLEGRVARYMPLKSFYNTQNRVIIANAFLSSIFSYLFRFYMMGEDYQKDVESLISSWLVPANRFRYDHLTAKTREAGLTQPLQDIFKLNIAALLRMRPTLPKPLEKGNGPGLHWGDGASMLMDEHIQRAAYFFHALTDLYPSPELEQKTLYKSLLERDPTPLHALAQKWDVPGRSRYLGPTQSLARAKLVVSKTSELPAKLPSKVRYHIFELIHNAIPTKAREAWRGHSLDCTLCGEAPESVAHLHKCPTSLLATSIILSHFPNRNDFMHILDSQEDDYLFVSDMHPKKRLILVVFSLAIWRTRRHFVDRPFSQNNIKLAALKIARYFIRTYKSIHYKKKRKERDKIKERQVFLTLFESIPESHVCIFTDGSSLGNPGPSGAGYFMSTKNIRDIVEGPCWSLHIPMSTNNAAELTALSHAVDHALKACTTLPHTENKTPVLHFFVDNQYTINTALRKYRTRAHKQIIRTLLTRLDLLSEIAEYHIHWVPGHAGVYGNEIADWLAKRGAKGVSSDDRVPLSVLQAILRKNDRDQLDKLTNMLEEEEFELELADDIELDEDRNDDDDYRQETELDAHTYQNQDQISDTRQTTYPDNNTRPNPATRSNSMTNPATPFPPPPPPLPVPGDRCTDASTMRERAAHSSTTLATNTNPQPLRRTTRQPPRRSTRKRHAPRLVTGIDFTMYRPKKYRKHAKCRVDLSTHSHHRQRQPTATSSRALGAGPTSKRTTSITTHPKPKRLRQTHLGRFLHIDTPPSPTEDQMSMEVLLSRWDDIHGNVAARDRAGTASLGQAESPSGEPPPFGSLVPLIESFHPGVDPGERRRWRH